MNYQIIEACPNDAKAILEYLKIVGGQTNNLSIDDRGLLISEEEERVLLQNYQENKDGVFLLAKSGDEIICVATAFPTDNRRHSHVLNFAISVKKKYWGQGVAGKVMDEVIDLARKRGFYKIILYVLMSNESAIKLYLKKGFEIEGKLAGNMKIDDEYFDDYYMGKIL